MNGFIIARVVGYVKEEQISRVVIEKVDHVQTSQADSHVTRGWAAAAALEN
ncbi:MAG: hypothetical protein ACRD8W_11530 [Nitrososphaeraceae archaeon]